MHPDPALAQARDLVAADLGDPRTDPLLEAAVAHRTWWLQQWPDGAPHVLGLLAQDVQEAVHEAEPLWPACPEHRDHPLFVEPDLGPDPFWVCHRTGLPVAAVGSLRG
ncbi:MAG: hypothetical protein JWO60_3251 [Frankiales bacterium]|nr:hypothetical protein [Frankiales bacterium]